MGYKIKEYRQKIGMTQVELSEKSHVSRAIISDLETGSRTVTKTDTLMKIASALGCKVSDIFFEETV